MDNREDGAAYAAALTGLEGFKRRLAHYSSFLTHDPMCALLRDIADKRPLVIGNERQNRAKS